MGCFMIKDKSFVILLYQMTAVGLGVSFILVSPFLVWIRTLSVLAAIVVCLMFLYLLIVLPLFGLLLVHLLETKEEKVKVRHCNWKPQGARDE